MPGADITPVAADDAELDQLAELARHLQWEAERGRVQLTDGEGHELPVPASVQTLLLQLVRALASGHAVTVVAMDAELTTQQAADVLGVSRPHLIKLLEESRLPHVKVGTHRRVRLADVLEYKRTRGAIRRKTLRRTTAEAERDGLPY